MGIVGIHPGCFPRNGKYRTYRREVCMSAKQRLVFSSLRAIRRSGKERTYSNGIFAMMEVKRARGNEDQQSSSIGLVNGTSRLRVNKHARGKQEIAD